MDFDVILREALFPTAFMMSKQAFMMSLILSGGVISIQKLSPFIYRQKKEAPKAVTAFEASFYTDIRL